MCVCVCPADKAKSLHALALVPAIEMDPESLSAIPDGSTPCPFPDPHDNKRGQKRHFEDQVSLLMCVDCANAHTRP